RPMLERHRRRPSNSRKLAGKCERRVPYRVILRISSPVARPGETAHFAVSGSLGAMVGDVAVTPLRFTGDFLTALAAADDQRGIADVLAAELHQRLRLDGVLVHDHLAGR